MILIKKGSPFDNDYKLIRVLERKYRAKDYSLILDFIRENKLADYTYKNGLYYYIISEIGEIFIQNNHSESLAYLNENYLDAVEFTNVIFKKYEN